MDFFSILNHDWFIAGATFVATVIFIPSVNFMWRWFRSRKGPFSARYVSFTVDDTGSFLVEAVNLRHIGEKLEGSIRGVAFLELDQKDNSYKVVGLNHGKYSLTGMVLERTIVVTYKTILRHVHNAGVIVLEADKSGILFDGNWAGTTDSSIKNSQCFWIRTELKRKEFKSDDYILSMAKGYLANRKTKIKSKPGNPIIPFVEGWGTSKTRFALESISKLRTPVPITYEPLGEDSSNVKWVDENPKTSRHLPEEEEDVTQPEDSD